MRSNCFLLALLLVGIHPALGPPMMQSGGQFKLVSVKVIGSSRYQESEIVRAAGLKLAAVVTPDTLKEAAQRLGTAGVFAEVNYRYHTRGEELTAEFTVKDAAQFLPCTFENFVWLSRDELLNGVRSRVPLFDGQVPPGGDMLESVSSGLVAMLEERGIHAQVEFSPRANLGGPVQSMQFRVVGIPMPVLKVAFTGVQKVDPASLQEAARPLIGKDFDASFIGDFSNAGIASLYRRQGYLKARFGDPVPQLLKGAEPPNSVQVTIPVREGEQYRLKEITWLGQSVIPYKDLEKSIRLRPGSSVNAVQLEQDVLVLPMLFHAKGYLTAEVKPSEILDDPSLTAVYQMRIRQGELYRLGRLEIAGLDDSHVRSLEKLCQLRPGDPYDRSYWNTFIQQVGRSLPPNASGWKASTQETIKAETKTVDVKLTFAPGASR